MQEGAESDMAYHNTLCGAFVMGETILLEVEGENDPLVCFSTTSQGKVTTWWKVILCFDLSDSF